MNDDNENEQRAHSAGYQGRGAPGKYPLPWDYVQIISER